jgi:hypothetical protein
LVEQLIRNQQVTSSSLVAGSRIPWQFTLPQSDDRTESEHGQPFCQPRRESLSINWFRARLTKEGSNTLNGLYISPSTRRASTTKYHDGFHIDVKSHP